MQKAAFLDRDGTIIEDSGYVHERDKVKFLPGAGPAIRLLNEHGFKVIVITNQAGVARGLFTEAAVQDINKYVSECLAREKALIDMMYYCPHHADGTIPEYTMACDCRKPNTGMIDAAVREFDIDVKQSVLIGDKASDIEAGRRAGCLTILTTTNEVDREKAGVFSPDYVTTSLLEAVKWLILK